MCVLARVRPFFPPLTQYVHIRTLGFARLLWPCTDTHTNTHSHTLFSEASPAVATLHIHTRTLARTVKDRRSAELQQPGPRAPALLLCHWIWSKLAVLLARKQLAESAGSLVSTYFLFPFMSASAGQSVCVLCTQTSGI